MKRGLAVLVLTVCLASCQHYVAHPGSVNTFDSQAYDSILVTKTVIDSTKTDIANGVFGSLAGTVTTAVDALVTAYNVADTAYQAYHNAAVAGTATTAQINAVTADISALNTQVTNLATVKTQVAAALAKGTVTTKP